MTNDPTLKTYKVLIGETHAQYYEVLAENEDQARERAYYFDEDESWALDTWDDGIVDANHAETEEIEDEPTDQEMMSAFGTKWHDGI
tara:strand:+ start:227 stop:487 length:261 start_codon:yes stop_codon:yes gene_type:complete